MTVISATQAKNNFGELLERTQREPVEISKKGRTVAVMLSADAFQQMQAQVEGVKERKSIDGILNWIEGHPAKQKPMDLEDYQQHLDGKYG